MKKIDLGLALAAVAGAMLLMGAGYSHSAGSESNKRAAAATLLTRYAPGIANSDVVEWNRLVEQETALLLEAAYRR